MFLTAGGIGKPNSVILPNSTMNSEERTIISLGERPILFLHQRGFATPPCHHGVRCVALLHRITFHFSEVLRDLQKYSYCRLPTPSNSLVSSLWYFPSVYVTLPGGMEAGILCVSRYAGLPLATRFGDYDCS